MQSFDYVAPKSTEEVATLLAGKNGDARILAGGTDLIVQLREGRRNAKIIIDVKNISELTQVTFDPKNGPGFSFLPSFYSPLRQTIYP